MIKSKKRISIITGLALLLIMPIVCWADNEAAENVGGTVPVIRELLVSGGYPGLFSDITVDDFQAGFRATNEGNVILTVLSNAPWKVCVKAEFTPVKGYVKPPSDLLLTIRDKNILSGGSGGRFDNAFVNFGPLSNKEQTLWMSEESGDHCQARIDYKLLLSPVRDMPGNYAAKVTYTISAP